MCLLLRRHSASGPLFASPSTQMPLQVPAAGFMALWPAAGAVIMLPATFMTSLSERMSVF